MHRLEPISGLSKPEQYLRLERQARALMAGESDAIANAANLSALLYHSLPAVNWVGFYFLDRDGDGELVLGPFQGKPACVRIAPGRGVCGTAAATGCTQVVPDVEAFPGHIACDADSRAEIVVPLRSGKGGIWGVLDIDSPEPGRFDDADRRGLESLVAIYLEASRSV